MINFLIGFVTLIALVLACWFIGKKMLDVGTFAENAFYGLVVLCVALAVIVVVIAIGALCFLFGEWVQTLI